MLERGGEKRKECTRCIDATPRDRATENGSQRRKDQLWHNAPHKRAMGAATACSCVIKGGGNAEARRKLRRRRNNFDPNYDSRGLAGCPSRLRISRLRLSSPKTFSTTAVMPQCCQGLTGRLMLSRWYLLDSRPPFNASSPSSLPAPAQ